MALKKYGKAFISRIGGKDGRQKNHQEYYEAAYERLIEKGFKKWGNNT